MSDLEFQRELSPDQLRQALSLLDSTAGVKIQNLPVEDLSPAEQVDPGTDQASATRPRRTSFLRKKTQTNVRGI